MASGMRPAPGAAHLYDINEMNDRNFNREDFPVFVTDLLMQ